MTLEDYTRNLFNNNFDLDNITCKQRGHTGTSNLITTTETVQGIETATEMFDSLRAHHFTAKAQSSLLRDFKTNPSQEEEIILFNFSLNYSFVAQDEVHGYHWNNAQATLHPLFVYSKETENAAAKEFGNFSKRYIS